ncbi:hypothetical protein PAXRUDRAFT_828433 [Paxillus rubicundulus Ve08.2h10]|uniref:Uncharacterized protein n=1 Tax=Paxillus rubicundulus Ve08.2h10 TaxID=930991 RepID=A0A0D0E7H6_9AGAM|nr:hypothetical protein PAXRUDRAFT_828433 [Paxillus rubicundulus Ve08.2h10]
MPTPTSAKRETFKRSQDFKHCATGPGWVCIICPEIHSKGQLYLPNLKAALRHERTFHEYLRDEAGRNMHTSEETARRRTPAPVQSSHGNDWGKIDYPRLTAEGLRKWDMHTHVDHVFDLVPFWQCAVDAAGRGEVLRLEEFLEKMEGNGGWRTSNEVLRMLAGWNVSEGAHEDGGHDWGQPNMNDWAASQGGGLVWGESHANNWAGTQRGCCGAASTVPTRVASDATQSSAGRHSGWGCAEDLVAAEDLTLGHHARPGVVLQGHLTSGGDIGSRLQPYACREGPQHFVDSVARQKAVNEERRQQMHVFFEMPTEQKIQKIQETIRFLRTQSQT